MYPRIPWELLADTLGSAQPLSGPLVCSDDEDDWKQEGDKKKSCFISAELAYV
jgi:hypothetical protein